MTRFPTISKIAQIKNKNKVNPPQMSYARTTQFNSRRQTNWSRNQNTVAFASAVKLGPVTHTVLVALMLTILGLIYLTQATRVSGYDYAANEVANKISNLTEQKNDLEVENARLTALQSVKDSSVAKNMATPKDTRSVSE